MLEWICTADQLETGSHNLLESDPHNLDAHVPYSMWTEQQFRMQEASPQELAPLQAEDIQKVATMLQAYGADPDRWQTIASTLPSRKPHSLARLWAHHVSGLSIPWSSGLDPLQALPNFPSGCSLQTP